MAWGLKSQEVHGNMANDREIWQETEEDRYAEKFEKAEGKYG